MRSHHFAQSLSLSFKQREDEEKRSRSLTVYNSVCENANIDKQDSQRQSYVYVCMYI